MVTWLVAFYWCWLVVSMALLAADSPGRLGIPGQALLVVTWLLVWRFRRPLGAWAARLPLGPVWVRYSVVGLLFADVIGENFGVDFRGDLHPNLAINSFLWVGTYAGVLLGWWILARCYRWRPWRVYALSGLMGVLIEQDFLIPRLIASGQVVSGLMAMPFVHAVYGSMVAPVFALMEQDVARREARPGIAAQALAVVLPGALFYVGGLWILLWLSIVPAWARLYP